MSALSVRLPESIHRKLAEVAEREGISINQLINSAVAEKMSALMTVLAKVPDVEPDENDRLTAPSGKRRRSRAS